MAHSPLDELALRYGIAPTLPDIHGSPHPVSDRTKRRILAAFGIEVDGEGAVAMQLENAARSKPPVMRAARGTRCFLPEWLEDGRAWGITVQLYELRSRRNWGIGDFGDLAAFSQIAAATGADFVGTNPLHALFLADPDRCSPFSPSSRRFLNPIYIAVDRLPGSEAFAEAPEVEELRQAPLVDYRRVAQVKLAALRSIWSDWQRSASHPTFSDEDFALFRQEGGEALRRHALFEALSFNMVEQGHGSGWQTWPAEYRNVEGPSVHAFAQSHADEVSFHIWLQWLADTQLAEAADAARQAGMRIGLYLDFAVGETPDGSASWSNPELAVPEMNIGAPPDFFTAGGQDWGLAPPSPVALREGDHAAYRQMMDAVIRHAGALRIDHAMSLWQLFFVPRGGTPAGGAYVRYPIEDLLRVLAETSNEKRAIVIGEDLGHVPDGFRDLMEQVRMLSYRVLYFEQNAKGFIEPTAYPHLALACLSTHDLPTLKGWWSGDDIDLRREHGLIEADAARDQHGDRARQRRALMRSLGAKGPTPAELSDEIMVETHRFIAKTPSVLCGVRLADLVGEVRPTNLPGTVDSYPNWRPKAPLLLEEIAEAKLFGRITRTVAAERPKPR